MSLREHLQNIYDEYGYLTPQLVVQEASNPEHPLHIRFEWDDESAANSWRLSQAHELIRRCRVVYREADEKGPERSVRAFHAVRSEAGYGYEPAEKVVRDEFLSKLVMADMQREWQALKRRFDHFQEFWELVRADDPGQAA